MPSVDVVHGSCGLIDSIGNSQGIRRDIDFNNKEALFWTPIMQPEAFVRRQIVERVGPPRVDLEYFMDKEWWLRMASAGARFHRIDDTLAALRYHGLTKTSNQWGKESYHKERDLILREYWDAFGLGFRLPRNDWLRRRLHSGMDFYSRVLHQIRIIQLYGRPGRITPAIQRSISVSENFQSPIKDRKD